MIFLFWALALCALTTYMLREGLFANGEVHLSGFDTEGLLLGIAAFVAAAWFFGPMYGVALVVSVMVHEYGHVTAYRICGHHDARFRLIPLMGGVAMSDRAPDTQIESFFISIMGPAICLAPMTLAFAMSDIILPVWPEASHALWIFGSVTGVLNFFNLLPFWPLDGGKCIRNIAYSFWPALASFLAIAMSAAFAAAAIWLQSIELFIFALFGAQSLLMYPDISNLQDAIPRRYAIVAAAAYGFTMAAHFVGGFTLITLYVL